MHLAEGTLPLSHALSYGALAAPWLALCARAERHALDAQDGAARALSGVGFALTFALTLLPVPVPVVGVTSHLCATPVLGLVLGARRVALTAAAVLLLQALFFAHGGLTTLGANVLTLGVVGPLCALALCRLLRGLGAPLLPSVAVACAVADLTVYLLDAAILSLALRGDRGFGHWLLTISAGLAPAQVPLAVLEGALSAAFLRSLLRRRAAMVPAWLRGRGAALPLPALAALAAMLLAAPAQAAPAEPAARYRGLDEVVLGAASAAAGRPARPLLPLGEGEVPVFLFSLGSFGAGVLAGRCWARLAPAPEGRRAPRG